MFVTLIWVLIAFMVFAIIFGKGDNGKMFTYVMYIVVAYLMVALIFGWPPFTGIPW